MPAPSYTYTLTNSTTADASQVMQNFNDILNGISDGSKDLSINALTCASTATFNGNVVMGNASSDTITTTASLASHLVPSVDGTYDLGSADIGFRALYLGDGDAETVKLAAPALAADWTLTLPTSAGTSGYVLQTNGSGTTSWGIAATAVVSKSADYTVLDNDGYRAINVTAAANVTITLPTAADNAGRYLTISKVDNGTGYVIIDGEGSETVHGAANLNLAFIDDTVDLVCDGTEWRSTRGFFSSYNPTGTFTWNGTGSPGNVATSVPIYAQGDVVSIFLSTNVRATTGTTSTTFTSDAFIPAAIRPGAEWGSRGGFQMRNNGTNDSGNVPYWSVASTGVITLQRDAAGTAFTNAANAGMQFRGMVQYVR